MTANPSASVSRASRRGSFTLDDHATTFLKNPDSRPATNGSRVDPTHATHLPGAPAYRSIQSAPVACRREELPPCSSETGVKVLVRDRSRVGRGLNARLRRIIASTTSPQRTHRHAGITTIPSRISSGTVSPSHRAQLIGSSPPRVSESTSRTVHRYAPVAGTRSPTVREEHSRGLGSVRVPSAEAWPHATWSRLRLEIGDVNFR